MTGFPHQYIDRRSGRICHERLFGDRLIRLLYHPFRERADWLFRNLTNATASKTLALFNYDLALASRVFGNRRFLAEAGLDRDECLDPPESLDTARKVFERKIRYWDCRPMPDADEAVVSPADSRVLVGSLEQTDRFFIKEKFFNFNELLGEDRPAWLQTFCRGDFAIFRLTPDKYHYNHVPVTGEVIDFYTIEGRYHSCNPSAVVSVMTPYSKNKRTVTIIDTDVPGGTGVGRVAMVEIVALMIGAIVQCYSRTAYHEPQPIIPGLFVHKGQPKSLYRPGSSTNLLFFERGRIAFAEDILANQRRRDVCSRFSRGFQLPMTETDLQVRSLLGTARPQDISSARLSGISR